MRAALVLTVLSPLALAACQSGGPPPSPSPSQAATGVTPNTFRLPTGEGCSGEVERFQAVMDNDLATGHTTKGVHSAVSGEISAARATCASGNQAGAIGQINGTISRFGYR